MKSFLAAAALIAAVSDSSASTRWVEVGTHFAKDGAKVTTYLDPSTVVMVGQLRRLWGLSDYSKPQVGNWLPEPGDSGAYRSVVELYIIDCQRKDFGFLSFNYYASPMGTGRIVRSTSSPDPSNPQLNTAVPGSIGEVYIRAACELRVP